MLRIGLGILLLLSCAAGSPRLYAEEPPAEVASRPDFLSLLLDPINPGRLQELLDKHLYPDLDTKPEKPEAPEIGEPIFFDLVRPLGSPKYSNEFNYLLNPSTRNAPTLQVLEYEYVIGDWDSIELDLSYYNRDLEILTPFYQRTLGVGRDGNWVHGIQISTDIYPRSKFVGGSAFYVYGWKPEKESKFSSLFFVGANRALIGGFAPIGSIPHGNPGDRTSAAWRPTFNANFFYKLNDRFTIGIENDLLFQTGRSSEYLVLPFITYDISEHAFIQAGAGYYHFESVDQATFMLHVNLVNPGRSRKKSGNEKQD